MIKGKKNEISLAELKYRQRLPLEVKERMSMDRIVRFVEEYGLDEVYISFSGGKDSTVLHHLVTRCFSDAKSLYIDTWMEYPQIRKFVKNFDNVDVRKPEKSMKQIIQDYGWCFPSKDVAEMIEAARRDVPWAIRKLNGLDGQGKPSPYRQQYKKWKKLVDAPFKVSNFCCIEMKEKVSQKYEKETGRKPILALMADESARRKEAYMRTGCNAFDSDRPSSKPIGFWTEQDILHYIVKYGLEIAEPYGDIVEVGQVAGQMSFGCANCKLRTTKEERTGCMFCPVGCHLDNMAKFERLREYNPRLYDYCMEELGEKEVLEWIRKNYMS